MPIRSYRQNCTAINLKALNMAEGHVQRFRALRATTKQVISYKVCENVIISYEISKL